MLMHYQKVKLRPAELCRWPEPLKSGWQGWNGMPINGSVLLRFSVTDCVLILHMLVHDWTVLAEKPSVKSHVCIT